MIIKNYLKLFYKPMEFLSSEEAKNSKFVILPLYLTGVVTVAFPLRTGNNDDYTEEVFSIFELYWSYFWAACLVFAVFGMLKDWFIGGWWYNFRLKLSGEKNTSLNYSRKIYAYTDSLISIPALIGLLIMTIYYESPLDSVDNRYFILLIIGLYLMSIGINYKAAVTIFTVNKRKARIWFLALPLSLYFIAILATLYTFFYG